MPNKRISLYLPSLLLTLIRILSMGLFVSILNYISVSADPFLMFKAIIKSAFFILKFCSSQHFKLTN